MLCEPTLPSASETPLPPDRVQHDHGGPLALLLGLMDGLADLLYVVPSTLCAYQPNASYLPARSPSSQTSLIVPSIWHLL